MRWLTIADVLDMGLIAATLDCTHTGVSGSFFFHPVGLALLFFAFALQFGLQAMQYFELIALKAVLSTTPLSKCTHSSNPFNSIRASNSSLCPSADTMSIHNRVDTEELNGTEALINTSFTPPSQERSETSNGASLATAPVTYRAQDICIHVSGNDFSHRQHYFAQGNINIHYGTALNMQGLDMMLVVFHYLMAQYFASGDAIRGSEDDSTQASFPPPAQDLSSQLSPDGLVHPNVPDGRSQSIEQRASQSAALSMADYPNDHSSVDHPVNPPDGLLSTHTSPIPYNLPQHLTTPNLPSEGDPAGISDDESEGSQCSTAVATADEHQGMLQSTPLPTGGPASGSNPLKPATASTEQSSPFVNQGEGNASGPQRLRRRFPRFRALGGYGVRFRRFRNQR